MVNFIHFQDLESNVTTCEKVKIILHVYNGKRREQNLPSVIKFHADEVADTNSVSFKHEITNIDVRS